MSPCLHPTQPNPHVAHNPNPLILGARDRLGVYLLSPPSRTKPSDALSEVGVPATLSELDRPADDQLRRWLRYRKHRGPQASTWGRTVTALVQLLSRRRGIQLQRTPQILAHVQPLRPSTRAASSVAALPAADELPLDELGKALPVLAGDDAAAGSAAGEVDEESLASTCVWRVLDL